MGNTPPASKPIPLAGATPGWLDRRSTASLAGLLGLLLLAAYINAFSGDFVIDNKLLILQDPRVQELSWENVRAIFTRDYWWPSAVVGVYRPVAKLTYLLNYVIPGGGTNPFGYHIVNLLLQWVCTVTVFLLLARLLRNRRTAFFGAALFGLHPVATEAVANIVGRTDILAGLSVFGALLCFIRSLETGGRRKVAWLAGMSAITVAGLWSKENAVCIIAVIPLYALCFLPWSRAWRASVAGLAALAPAYLIAFGMRIWVAANAMPPQFPFVDNPLVGTDFITARLTAIKVVAHYVRLMVWPARLSCDYSYNQIPLATWSDPGFWAGMAIMALILAALWFWFLNNRPAFFLTAFAAVLFLPTSNLFFNIGNIMGERYLYVSLAGFCGLVAMGLSRLPARIGMTLGAILLLLCGARTLARNTDWKDTLSIWTAAAQACPGSCKAHKAYGSSLHEHDPQNLRIDDSIAAAKQGLAIMESPPIPVANQFGGLYADLGAYYLEKAELLPDPTHRTARMALYRAAVVELRKSAAIESATTDLLLRQAIQLGRPIDDLLSGFGDYHIYGNMGVALMRLGENGPALTAFERMHRLAPGEPKGYLGESWVYRNRGQFPEAIVCVMQALLLDSGNTGTWQDLFALHKKAGTEAAAIKQVDGKPQLNLMSPLVKAQLAEAYEGLARHFERNGNVGMAESLRRQAIQQAQPQNVE